jgi:hypothetical protein
MLPFAVRNLWGVIARRAELARVDLSFDALSRPNRLQRFKLVAKAFKDAARTPRMAPAGPDGRTPFAESGITLLSEAEPRSLWIP